MAWEETLSDHFAARHDSADAGDARAVLGQLEEMRARMENFVLPSSRARTSGRRQLEEVAVVLHGSTAQLHAAQPLLPVLVRMTAPAGRRYIAGRAAGDTIHVLSSRQLQARATSVEGSAEMLRLTPAALYGRLVVAELNPKLRSHRQRRRWAWLAAGAAEWLAGRTGHARGAIGRRLHEGPAPAFPPAPADALLLGGTLVDLLAREEGFAAVLELIQTAATEVKRPDEALRAAFHGRPLHQTEATWRALLARSSPRAART